jgi:bifunctional enzyme CysN/CysC
VTAWPSGRTTTVAEIDTPSGPVDQVVAPAAVTLRLADQIDLGRGDLLSDSVLPPSLSRSLDAELIWMASAPLRTNTTYILKHTTRLVNATVRRIVNRLDIQTFTAVEAPALFINDIGEVEIETHEPLACDPYYWSRSTGSFILIDAVTNETVAAGMIRGTEQIDRPSAPVMAHSGLTVWFTGLSGAGKSTLSRAVQNELAAQGYRTEILDGDIVRQYLSKGLGFSREDRDENIRRIGFVANLLTRNGVIVLVAAISPYRTARNDVRTMVGKFLEVYVNAPVNICESRDPKGLYGRARRGELRGFTGIDDPYEPPESPDLECRTDLEMLDESVSKVLAAVYNALRPH